MRKFLTVMLTTGALLGVAGSASAANPATTTFTVAATVLKNCTVGATNLAFGAYTPGAGTVTQSSTVQVNCSKNTKFTVSLGVGNNGTFVNRAMSDGSGDLLEYNLFTTNTYATVWGDGTGATTTVAGTGAGMGSGVLLPVYGQLVDSPANQAQPPGAYTDTVTVSVAY